MPFKLVGQQGLLKYKIRKQVFFVSLRHPAWLKSFCHLI